MDDVDVAALRAELENVRATVASLDRRNAELEHQIAVLGERRESDDVATGTSRRGVLRLAGAAAAGAVAAAVSRPGSVAAANAETVQIGFQHPGTQQTKFVYGVAAKVDLPGDASALALVEADNLTATPGTTSVGLRGLGHRTGVVGEAEQVGVFGRAVTAAAGTPSTGVQGEGGTVGVAGTSAGTGVVGSGTIGVSGTGTTSHGVFGTSTAGAGVTGLSTNAVGVSGSGATFGVQGLSTAPTGAGISGSGTTGVDGNGTTGPGVDAFSASGIGVVALSNATIGVAGSGPVIGVRGTGLGSGDGVVGFGRYSFVSEQANTAALLLKTTNGSGPKAPPPLRADAHVQGEIDNDSDGNLWYCVTSGTPGTWRKLAGTASSGTFHAVTPSRVYDSRAAKPFPGPLKTGENRPVSVAVTRDLASGEIANANFVPFGATAVACNVTVVNTVNPGFLTLNPGGNTVVSAASVNWFGTGQILNNGIIVAINPATLQLTAIVGGGAGTQTDFVVDVTGYFA